MAGYTPIPTSRKKFENLFTKAIRLIVKYLVELSRVKLTRFRFSQKLDQLELLKTWILDTHYVDGAGRIVLKIWITYVVTYNHLFDFNLFSQKVRRSVQNLSL